ncbi:MAG: hypothetical protein V4649_02180 [Bacteroidota bacterium]
MRRYLLSLVGLLAMHTVEGQSLKKPDVPTPSLLKIKQAKGISRGGSGYMGLFDWNFSAGYIDKTASQGAITAPLSLNTSGQYFMFHWQDGLLSNYFLAKSYKRDKRIKFGFQNTVDLGLKRGVANGDSSNYAFAKESANTGKLDFFVNYQAGLAVVVRVNRTIDVGYTYYPYVKSVFSPDIKNYSKVRARISRFMAEYSFNGKTSYEFKYLHSRKLYIGVSYTESEKRYSDFSHGTSNVATSWIHLSLGRVF